MDLLLVFVYACLVMNDCFVPYQDIFWLLLLLLFILDNTNSNKNFYNFQKAYNKNTIINWEPKEKTWFKFYSYIYIMCTQVYYNLSGVCFLLKFFIFS